MAYKYAISFRIDTDTHGGRTYLERYSSFMDQVRKTSVWEETTSFALTVSDETLENFVARLYLGSKFNAITDLMVVIDIERGVAVTKGKVSYPATLSSMLNRLVQK
jgi:hypothetical protein